ncbi:MAG: ribonuclease H-like domain-containing protein [Chloroflexi bacterium]|nr:ribonuclease H-like domain-containing protein [Chloroflexota bacterium]
MAHSEQRNTGRTMAVSEELRRRLRQLGVVHGARELANLPASGPGPALEDLVTGRFITTSHGRCFVAESTYPCDYAHGDIPLGAFLGVTPGMAAHVSQDDAFCEIDLKRAGFLDTETTGLSAGTGTMAFVVGLGHFCDTGFQVRQYFLRDPGDEPAMIETLKEDLCQFDALVSFNGKTFDVPIIETRFTLARMSSPTIHLPHLDLLHPARRLWRYHLESCRLGMLEQEILGVIREQADVPSGIIPFLYRDYLRTGDAREMQRVLYHNEVDILSLVTLAVRICAALGETASESQLSGAELYGLGRWRAATDSLSEAEWAYRAALTGNLHPDLRLRAMRDLAQMLKQTNRGAEAFAFWQQCAIEHPGEHFAQVELAKYLEWHVGNIALASDWVRHAISQVRNQPSGYARAIALEELEHRLARLERKLAHTMKTDTGK